MMDLYTKTSLRTSKGITKAYSTSFSLGILGLSKPLRDPIYAVYGFVRVADEIVDTFHGTNQRDLLERFWAETDRAIDEGISTNPVLHAFQYVVNAYQIDRGLINTFLRSMEMDLEDRTYDQSAYEQYILGSAEVVGLMCLKVFVNGDQAQYEVLTPFAMKLGSAFQKINFLRDVAADFQSLGRTYFPNVDLAQFDDDAKMAIERDIERDFRKG
jgi:phytoene/squalene synthetase